jgi:hypothetical protein
MLISIILLLVFPQSIAAGVFGSCISILNLIYFEQMNSVINIVIINNNTKKQLFALFRLLLANFLMSHLVALLMIAITLLP